MTTINRKPPIEASRLQDPQAQGAIHAIRQRIEKIEAHVLAMATSAGVATTVAPAAHADAIFESFGPDNAYTLIQTNSAGLLGVSFLPASLGSIYPLVPAADRLPYYTGATTAALATLTAFGRTLLDDVDAAAGRTTLGLGTMATQNASAVAITGGTIDGTTIGATTPAAGTFTALASTGNTTLGDASADTLTINAGTWTLGSNFTATRAAGVVAAGVSYLCRFDNTFVGDSGGTSDVIPWNFEATSSGAAPIVTSRVLRTLLTHAGTGTLTLGSTLGSAGFVSSTGNVTTFNGIQHSFVLFSSGGITEAKNFIAATPGFGSTGTITTARGFTAENQGNATLVTNALGFDAADQTAVTLAIGYRSQVSSGTGKWGFQATGNANNAFQGSVRIGSLVAPTVALDVTGAIAATSTITSSSRVEVTSVAPEFRLTETDQAADNRIWFTYSVGGTFRIQPVTDALVGGANVLDITRSGNLIQQLRFGNANVPVFVADEGTDTSWFKTGATGALVVSSPGNPALISASLGNHVFQVQGNVSTTVGSASLFGYSAGNVGPVLSLGKSKSATIGTNTAVIANDNLGTIRFDGADGTNYVYGGGLLYNVDAAVSAGVMPSRFEGHTATAAGVVTRAFSVNRNQHFGIGVGIASTDEADARLTVVAENATDSHVHLRGARVAIEATTNKYVSGLKFWSNDTNLTAPGLVAARIEAIANATHTLTNTGTMLVFSATGATTAVTTEVARMVAAASAVNNLEISSAATGAAVNLAAIGSDTNISLQLSAKGTGIVLVGDTGTATATAGAATLNTQRGTITSESLTTAAGADYTLTLTNSKVTTTSKVLPTVDNGSNTTEGLSVQRVTPAAGSVVILVRNTHAANALNGTIKIGFLVT